MLVVPLSRIVFYMILEMAVFVSTLTLVEGNTLLQSRRVFYTILKMDVFVSNTILKMAVFVSFPILKYGCLC